MPTLHIGHGISDFEVWQQAFKRFDGARQQAGVRSQEVRRPVDDAQYVVIDLDFDTVEQAERFRNFCTRTSGHRPPTRRRWSGLRRRRFSSWR